MKKLLAFIGIFMLINSSLYPFLDRTRAFFSGRRYDNYDYDGYGRRYYSRPRYVYTYDYPTYNYKYVPNWVTSRGSNDGVIINENNDNYTISITLPGYDKNDIRITALDKSIKVYAKAPLSDNKNIYGPGTTNVEETISLGTYIQPNNVRSEYLNGVVTITAPKRYASTNQGINVPIK